LVLIELTRNPKPETGLCFYGIEFAEPTINLQYILNSPIKSGYYIILNSTIHPSYWYTLLLSEKTLRDIII